MNKIIYIFIVSFFCVGSLLAQEKNDYIDIKGSLYQRIQIHSKWEGTAIYNTRFVLATLKKNLEWSGVFAKIFLEKYWSPL